MSGGVNDAILAVDIAVVAHDLLWGSDHLNSLTRKIDDANVDAYVTLLEAAAALTPDHPAVIVIGPCAAEEALDQLSLVPPEPNVALVFTVDDPAGALGRRVRQAAGVTALPADEADLIDDAVDAALLDRREAARQFPVESEPEDYAITTGPSERMRTVVLTSAKGGAGTTTVSINLAAALAKRGDARVALLDAHRTTGDIGLLLGIEKREQFDLDEIVIDADTIDYLSTTHLASGLRVVTPPSDGTRLKVLSVEQLLRILVALEPTTDIVVVDMPLDLALSSEISRFAGAVLVVTTGHLSSMKNAIIAADLMGRDKRMGLVVNDTIPEPANPDRGQIESIIKVRVVGELPFDDDISTGARGTPVNAISGAKSRYSKLTAELAKELVDHFIPEPRR